MAISSFGSDSTDVSVDEQSHSAKGEMLLSPTPSTKNTLETEPARKKRGRENAISSKLAATLEASKVSIRSATKIIFYSAENFNVSPSEINVNKSSMHRARTKYRNQNAKQIKTDFLKKLDNKSKLVVHFDGKRMTLNGGTIVEWLPVLITSPGMHNQLLGSPTLLDGTGAEQANAVVFLLKEWGICDMVQAVCIDTSSNTGRKKGTCVLIEQQLGKTLLYLACRHHMVEIVLKNVFEAAVFVSAGPEIYIFKILQTQWPNIDQKKFSTGIEDDEIALILRGKLDELL